MRAYSIPFLSAVVWIGAALLVAFPGEFYSFDLVRLSGVFMSAENFSRIFIPLLIFTDIIIALLVGHYKTSQVRFGIIVVTMVLYVVFAIAPEVTSAFESSSAVSANVDGTEVPSSENNVFLFCLLMLFLLAIRSISFYDEDRNIGPMVEMDAESPKYGPKSESSEPIKQVG